MHTEGEEEAKKKTDLFKFEEIIKMNELCLVEIKEFKKVRESEQTQRLINGFQWKKTETFVNILNTLQLSYNLTALLITKCDSSSV